MLGMKVPFEAPGIVPFGGSSSPDTASTRAIFPCQRLELMSPPSPKIQATGLESSACSNPFAPFSPRTPPCWARNSAPPKKPWWWISSIRSMLISFERFSRQAFVWQDYPSVHGSRLDYDSYTSDFDRQLTQQLLDTVVSKPQCRNQEPLLVLCSKEPRDVAMARNKTSRMCLDPT